MLIIGISGILLIRTTFDNRITVGILWLTAIVIMQYTKETYLLKQVQKKDLKNKKAPFVIVHFTPDEDCDEQGNLGFVLKNVGQGVARNVDWKVVGCSDINFPKKTIISPIVGHTKIYDSQYTNLKPSAIRAVKPYEIEINYENADGIKYRTKLKSGQRADDYEVLKYGEVK